MKYERPIDMNTKMFEIRDAGTFIPVVCIEMQSGSSQEDYLLRRLGFSHNNVLIQMVWISSGKTQYDYEKWNDRTLLTAHKFIAENWSALESGDVIDVEFILGETSAAKPSERIWETW
jgi:hypothetical protein